MYGIKQLFLKQLKHIFSRPVYNLIIFYSVGLKFDDIFRFITLLSSSALLLFRVPIYIYIYIAQIKYVNSYHIHTQ